MEVFLIPAGNDRYELYCEIRDEAPALEEVLPRPWKHRIGHWFSPAGWKQRMGHRFAAIVRGVERARPAAARRRASGRRRSFGRRVRDRAVCWLAEKIAEQRLLWHLRSQDHVTGWFPDDITERQASDQIREILRADADRHLRWLIVNFVGLLVSFLLVPIPGPNLVLYYFIFRVGGHFLSRRGARHGLQHVEWQMRESAALTELRNVFTLEPHVRHRRVAEIAGRLRLQHLAAFFERIAPAAS